MINEEKLKELIPEHMQGGVRRWIENGILPGGFLTCVLENDLKGALGRADMINRHRLFEIVEYFYSYAPALCWGSVEKVAAWERKFKYEEHI